MLLFTLVDTFLAAPYPPLIRGDTAYVASLRCDGTGGRGDFLAVGAIHESPVYNMKRIARV
jgi:hypothetical protein